MVVGKRDLSFLWVSFEVVGMLKMLLRLFRLGDGRLVMDLKMLGLNGLKD